MITTLEKSTLTTKRRPNALQSNGINAAKRQTKFNSIAMQKTLPHNAQLM
jgi:hypothetical protein